MLKIDIKTTGEAILFETAAAELCGCRFCVCARFEMEPVRFLPENIVFSMFFDVLAQIRYSPLDH